VLGVQQLPKTHTCLQRNKLERKTKQLEACEKAVAEVVAEKGRIEYAHPEEWFLASFHRMCRCDAFFRARITSTQRESHILDRVLATQEECVATSTKGAEQLHAALETRKLFLGMPMTHGEAHETLCCSQVPVRSCRIEKRGVG